MERFSQAMHLKSLMIRVDGSLFGVKAALFHVIYHETLAISSIGRSSVS